MISILKGTIESFKEHERYNSIEILTVGGIGYRVFTPSRISFERGKEITLYTSFQVREDSQTLYGFDSELERDFFELLLSVSGVGPKSGISILGTYSPDQIANLIIAGNYNDLSKVPGLGKKGAQKIVLELEGKLGHFDFEFSDVKLVNKLLMKELKEALKSLGFTGSALNQYLVKAEKLSKEVSTIDELLKLVLKEE